MTELYKYVAPNWLSTERHVNRLLNSLTPDTHVKEDPTPPTPGGLERHVSRPPLYPYTPM